MKIKSLFIFLIALFSVISLTAQTIYVSTKGNDNNSGTQIKPVFSFAKAQELAQKQLVNNKVEVVFAAGTYYLPQTVVLTSADNGITYRSETEGAAILSGGQLLKLKWKPYKNGIFEATMPSNIAIDQLFINGERQRMARYPNAIPGKIIFDTWDAKSRIKTDTVNNPLRPKKIASWKNPEGGYIHAMHTHLWGGMHYKIKRKNTDETLEIEGGWQNNRPSEMHGAYRIVENIFEELDVPGEWFYNKSQRKIYYMPCEVTDLKTAKVEVVRLKNLIEFEGSKNNPVKAVRLEGFVFRQAARTFMENKEPLLRSDWTIYRGGAVMFNGAENCTVENCEFDQLGGNAVFVNKYNKGITIRGCYIHNCGANGVAFVGDTSAVRSPQTFANRINFDKMDRTPGIRGTNYPQDCLVENCLITMIGRDEKQTAGVQVSMSFKIRINHCSIYDVPRAGINFGEGTFGGHIIENCDVFNTVLETGDHGSFNSWGRDRFWAADPKQTIAEVAKYPDMPNWDMVAPNIIRNNRWRCDHGWDVDLDDGSSNYQIYNNLMLNRGLKLREGYHRTITNNIILSSSIHPHCWYPDSKDVIKNNIISTSYKPAIMEKCIAPDGKWGKEIDNNLFLCETKSMARFAVNGCDKNSVFADPQFVDAKSGDFRVKENSPALKMGFVNFSMNQFGVQKAALKQIAKTPELPEVFITIPVTTTTIEKPATTWMDVVLSEPAGDEMSAYGVGFDDGGVLFTMVAENSLASKSGFRTGDLLQSINGLKIKTIQQLKDYISANGTSIKKHVLTVVRNQSPVKITINQELVLTKK
jgi:hypothetical protein